METFNNVVLSIKDFLWGPIMLCLLIGTHVLLTIRTKGIQRKTFTGVKLSVTPDKEASGDIGGFAALATALAATIGTGNIVGRNRVTVDFWCITRKAYLCMRTVSHRTWTSLSIQLSCCREYVE